MATLRLTDCQHRDPVPLAWLASRGRRAAQRLRIRRQGMIVVSFIDDPTMRALHSRFLGSRHATDVLTFRYADGATAGSRIIGEILIAPAAARRYAQAHRLSYRDELARYVIHGLLHWLGYNDRTIKQQQKMRRMEDRLLSRMGNGE